ncbi:MULTISPECIES: hypothetical protein [unclassified Cryobacterium]|uniref:hypothetical protein n=1 Tax=unclassified Cryobacterium TaxID=2649013 RepID=UPI002AB435F9|nr:MULTISPECIES: hypothetical protein [unclassified Cryobacterium]MDY7542541.1 hypothetical protein [Cryobacterium sp. 5B3]MEB0267343.1 hypothetical protein [Cryobacterium sp. 10I5]MEB0275180.1 hypothetical protein [Cryobacterium sp. 5B3]
MPITASGNAVSVIGDSASTGTPSASTADASAPAAGPTALIDTIVTFGASAKSTMPAHSGKVSAPAALSVTELASTGIGTLEFGGFAGLILLIAGAALMFMRRMNTGRMNV